MVLSAQVQGRSDAGLRQRSVYTYVRDVGLCSVCTVSHCPPLLSVKVEHTDFATGAIVYVCGLKLNGFFATSPSVPGLLALKEPLSWRIAGLVPLLGGTGEAIEPN